MESPRNLSPDCAYPEKSVLVRGSMHGEKARDHQVVGADFVHTCSLQSIRHASSLDHLPLDHIDAPGTSVAEDGAYRTVEDACADDVTCPCTLGLAVAMDLAVVVAAAEEKGDPGSQCSENAIGLVQAALQTQGSSPPLRRDLREFQT